MRERKQLEIRDKIGNWEYYDYEKMSKDKLFEIIASKEKSERVELWVYDYDEETDEYKNGELIEAIE